MFRYNKKPGHNGSQTEPRDMAWILSTAFSCLSSLSATSVLQVKASLAGHTLKGASGGAMDKSDNAGMEAACSPNRLFLI